MSATETLTKREIHVLQMIFDGLCDKEIAENLHVSLKTAKFHVSAIYRKYRLTGPAPKRMALLRRFGRLRIIWEPASSYVQVTAQ